MPDHYTETLAEDEREALTAAFAASTRNPDHLAFLAAPAVERILAARIVQARAGEGALREAARAGRRATLDPGAFVKRERDEDGDYERLDKWQERALLAAVAALTEADPS